MMHRNPFILIALLFCLFNGVFAKDAPVSQAAEKAPEPSQQSEHTASINDQPEPAQPEKLSSEIKYSVKGHPEVQNAKEVYADVQPTSEETPTEEIKHEPQSEIQKPENQQSEIQKPENQQLEIQKPENQQSEIKYSVKGHPELQNKNEMHADTQQDDKQTPVMEQLDQQHPVSHHSENHQAEGHQHAEETHSEMPPKDSQSIKQQVATGRQFHPPPYHQPMLFQPPTGFEAIRRQFGGGIGSDLVMMGLISLPIIGLLTMGSAGLGNLFGFGPSSGSKKSSSKRTRRSLKDKAADAVDYAKSLWNIMEQLEKAFEKYDLYQAECRLRVVCEAHHKDRRMGSWGQSILDLMRQQKELEGRELLPVSRFLFSNYAEAAQAGARNENCAQLYTGCPRHLSYYLSANEDQLENEIENSM